MFEPIHRNQKLQYVLGLLFGFLFGFLLQKGGVCRYEVLMGQLLLKDFTVVKVMLTAVAVGMVGVYVMRSAGWVSLHKKSGSLGTSIPGPILFGLGFGLLGYCPGTAVGALGHGALDALVGCVGIVIGAGLYAALYPKLKARVLDLVPFGDLTLIDYLGAKSPWTVVVPVLLVIGALFAALESAGF